MSTVRDAFATLTLLCVYLAFGIPVGLVGIPLALITKDVTWLYWASMWVTRTGVRWAGVRVQLSGLEHIPDGSCIFMANHVSNLDPPALVPMIPRRSVVLLKKELMSIPLLGRAMTMGGFIPVERGSRREAAQTSVAAATRAVRGGLPIVVFPEGTRSLDGRLARFKKGPFYLAQGTGAPIVPVAVWGTERCLPKGKTLITPGVVGVRLLQPIDPAGYATREELMAAVHAAIAEALPERMRPLAAAKTNTGVFTSPE